MIYKDFDCLVNFNKLFKRYFIVFYMKKRIEFYLVIAIIVSLLLMILYFVPFYLTGFAIFSQENQSDFDEGTYVNTEWNGSAVVLVGENLTGNYISKVFNAGAEATWNNISWNSIEPNLESFFCVDGGGEIFKSINVGVTWVMSKENYGRTVSTTDMFENQDYLYILSGTNKEVWRSSDAGSSFSVVNDTFSTNSFLIGASDSEDNLYVVTGPGEVFKSTNNGSTWNLLSDFNSGIYDAKGIAINSSDNIYIVDGAGDVYSSTDSGTTWTKVNDGYGGTTGTDGMVVDSNNNLYILLNSDVYSSTDSGTTWTKINDDFSPYSNDGMEINIDGNDNLWIADGIGRVFKSTDSGVNWVEIGDCNNAVSNNPKGLTNFIQSTNLDIQVESCDDDACLGESWIDIADTSPQDLSLDNNTYFQYQIIFSSEDASLTPQLQSIDIDYALLNQAPTINLVEPQNILYLTNESLNLTYTVSDSDGNLDSCWYWLDDGVNNSLTCGLNITFDTSEGSHILTIYANDSNGAIVNDSASFNIDATGVFISIIEPTGTKNTRTGLLLNYTTVGNNLTCWYNLETSIGASIIGNTSLANCSSSNFDVSTDGDYVLNLYVNNTIGSSDSDSSSFSVDTSTGGGGGGGGGGTTIITPEVLIKLEIESISDIVLKPGEIKKKELSVKNTGTSFLNNCRFSNFGDYSSWISGADTKNLAAGENSKFIFDVKVPEDVDPGIYGLSVSIECDELTKTTDFSVEILEEKLNLKLIEVIRERENQLKILYSLEELSGIDQEVEIQFLFFNLDEEKVAEIIDTQFISANSEQEFETSMNIASDLEGAVNLLINLNSESYSTLMRENVVIGSPVTGFAIFNNPEAKENLIIGTVVLLFIVFVLLMTKRIVKLRKKERKVKLKKRK